MAAPSGGGGGGGPDLGAAGALFLFGLGLWAAWGWNEDNRMVAARRAAMEAQTEIRPARTVSPSRTAFVPTGRKTAGMDPRTCSEAMALIPEIGAEYNVPAGLLYGRWKVESNGLCGGFGTSSSEGWYPVPSLLAEGGKCILTYGTERCERNYRAMRTICAQVRQTANGPQPICDPNAIWTAKGLEMGPTQFMPSTFFTEKKGQFVPSQQAVDYDRDGVYDPLSLPDALASAAKRLRIKYDEVLQEQRGIDPLTAWGIAGARYKGDGATFDPNAPDAPAKRLHQLWGQWCEIAGTCKRVAFAAR